MSVSDAVRWYDEIMSDGKWRSPKSAQKLFAARLREHIQSQVDQIGERFGGFKIIAKVGLDTLAGTAEAGWKKWFRLRSGPTDQGLRGKETGPLSGEKDQWGMPLRYFQYRIVPSDQWQPGGEGVVPRSPEQIKADRLAVIRRAAEEASSLQKDEDTAYRRKHGIPDEV